MMHPLAALVATESRLFLRDRMTVLLAIALPTICLLLLGAVPALRRSAEITGGLRFVDYYLPSLSAMSVALLGLHTLPSGLAEYREKGILRWLSATPMHPAGLFAARLLVDLGAAVAATTLLVGTAHVVLATPLPVHPVGFLAAFVLGTSAVFALGLVIAAAAPQARTATGIGTVAVLLVLFAAGVFLPRFLFPEVLVRIGQYVPPGVPALHEAWLGAGPAPPQLATPQLATMTVIAVIASVVTATLLRWE